MEAVSARDESNRRWPDARTHSLINVGAGVALSAGHIIAYRIVIIEFLCACVVRRKGPVAVVS